MRDWAPRFVDYFGGETRTPAYRAINVMGEVPVLEHRGSALIAIRRDPRLPRRDARRGSAPRDADERREILRWLLWDNHKLTSYTATYRFLRTFAKDPRSGGAGVSFARAPKPPGACSTRTSPAAATSSATG